MKNLSTPLRIIKILKLLTETPLSVDEIIFALEDDDNFLIKDTISKYFTTLRNAGCEVKKKNHKFYIKYPILHLDDSEFETLGYLQKNAQNICGKRDYEDFLKFLDKLFMLISKEDMALYSSIFQKIEDKNLADFSKFKHTIETLSQFMGETPQKIKITYEDETYNIIPLKFHYLKNSVSLFGHDIAKRVNRKFFLDKIQDIKQTPIIAQNAAFSLSTTFKITGRLKNSYTARNGEIVSDYKDHIVVTNKDEEKDELFNRLLKYGTNCEVLYPKNDRERFAHLVDGLISNFQ